MNPPLHETLNALGKNGAEITTKVLIKSSPDMPFQEIPQDLAALNPHNQELNFFSYEK